MKRLFLIGGAAGVGKTTIIDKLSNHNLIIKYVKPNETLMSSAVKLGYKYDDAFKNIEVINDLFYKTYLSYFVKYDIIIGDIHFAIQPNYDTAILLNKPIDPKLTDFENYICSIDYQFIQYLLDNQVLINLILINAKENEIKERRMKRKINVRTLNKISIQNEIEAERIFFKQVADDFKLNRFTIENNDLNQAISDCNIIISGKLK